MNRLLIPPTSFYNTISTNGLNPGAVPAGPLQPPLQQILQSQQQKQPPSHPHHPQHSSLQSEKSPNSAKLEHNSPNYPGHALNGGNNGFDFAAAVSAARSSQAAAAAMAFHASAANAGASIGPLHSGLNPHHPHAAGPPHNPPPPGMFGPPGQNGPVNGIFGGHPAAAAGFHPLLAAAASGHFPGYPGPDGFGPMDFNMITRRKNATRETTSALKAWLNEHKKNPYPTKGEKIMLAIITKMTLTQVSTWFANARRRLKKENKMTWAQGGSANDCDDDDDDIDDDDDDMTDKADDLDDIGDTPFNPMTINTHQIHTAQKPSQLGGDFEGAEVTLKIKSSSCSSSEDVQSHPKRCSSADILSAPHDVSSSSPCHPDPPHNSRTAPQSPSSPSSRSDSEATFSQSQSTVPRHNNNNSKLNYPTPQMLQSILSSSSNSGKGPLTLNLANKISSESTKPASGSQRSKIWSIADLATSPNSSSSSSAKTSNFQTSPSFSSPSNQISPIWKSPRASLDSYNDSFSNESANILKVENFLSRGNPYFPGFPGNPGAMNAAISAGFHPTFSTPIPNFAYNTQAALHKNF